MRSEFQSLFWHVLTVRKRETKFSLKALADKLGINKSYVSRSFSAPPNWTIDKLSDMAEALQVDLVLEARDRVSGRIYAPAGTTTDPVTSTVNEVKFGDGSRLISATNPLIDDDAHLGVTA